MIETENLIACPTCDAIFVAKNPEHQERAVCNRCHTVLIAPQDSAFLKILALATTVSVLMVAAVFLPFLRIERAGLSNASSVFDAALSFSDGFLLPLTLAVFALIVFIPLTRVLLLIYVLLPLTKNSAAFYGARTAFRWSEVLRPWAMAEIFVLGCAVALIKIVDLADVEIGPAFWLFIALVIINLLQDSYLCKWTIWNTLET
jgi:paraquat-inducible protein A